ncbi:TIGR03013 family PEP-CTERM/XrtA system glycosyltransferase [Rhodanobacter glycinis]|uniref:TIGR03013 family PEP-CTERM/XrtA system glycosyltransferase n=1 Tax=Rhodanobacter glycinis TaxID=582702 RepID=A0A502FMP5_9GAMM|nr:TIGR03013 family XrtA/PEP-CTERM system glycosyltransferase [Rhodanobacter glycinis]TPG05978.1 TIGR03013 family PEP-CTERM/XrtA system glycosyltransferase [Rhodanobacter glycinis]TPG50542.1 TIGR03013 family PEP-CTERM/XrtA system glycosyltransferase [Rhodanobacter glycinis]
MYRSFRYGVRWQLLLVLVEFVLLVGCVYAAVVLRYWGHGGTQSAFVHSMQLRALPVALVLIFSMASLGLYQVHLRAGWLGRLSRQGVAFVLGGVVLTVLYYALPPSYLGRGVLGIALLLGYLVVALWRVLFLSLVDADLFKRRVMILGAGERAAELIRIMRRKTDQRGFKILGCAPVGAGSVSISAPLLLHPDEALCEWVTELGVEEIVVGPDDRRGTLPVEALLECKRHGVAVTELAEFFEREAGKIMMELTNPSSLIFSDGFNISPVRLAIKRAFDLLTASLVLLVTWPFMLLTALAIRLESGGGAPILYYQDRVGENGKLFRVIKFRSMGADAERDGVARWATEHDNRVTRVGRFIRKARLDELPQLWNVLRGDMSIIGPRPERPQFVDSFNKCIRYYSLRHCLKPGLTGWAQLRYPYGSSLEDAEEKLKFDLFYVKNHNFVFDLAILVQTLEVVLFGRGAR